MEIKNELKKDTPNYLIKPHYEEESETAIEIIKLIEERFEFPDEDRIDWRPYIVKGMGLNLFFEYKGESANGLVINLLDRIDYDAMIEFNNFYEEIDFRKYNIAYMKESVFNKLSED